MPSHLFPSHRPPSPHRQRGFFHPQGWRWKKEAKKHFFTTFLSGWRWERWVWVAFLAFSLIFFLLFFTHWLANGHRERCLMWGCSVRPSSLSALIPLPRASVHYFGLQVRLSPRRCRSAVAGSRACWTVRSRIINKSKRLAFNCSPDTAR